MARRHEAALPWLASFVERMKANSFVLVALDASGKADVAVAA